MSDEPFGCWGCGACCKIIGLYPALEYLDRGDLACRHLQDDNSCGIYEDRPDLCNIRTMWEKEPLGRTWDEYKDANTEVCKILDAKVNGNE